MNECMNEKRKHFLSTYYVPRQASYQGNGGERARLSALTMPTINLALPQTGSEREVNLMPKATASANYGPRGQIPATACFCKYNFTEPQPFIYVFIYPFVWSLVVFVLPQQS